MTRTHRQLLPLCRVAAMLLALGSAAATAFASDSRPNIVVILADDMGYSDIGCYGSEIATPNLDRLAADGLRFTQFHNGGRCCPTRASLMTGLHPHQAGIGHMTAPVNEPLGIEGPYQGYLNDNCVTIAQVLKEAGYHTFMTGKWHLGVNSRDVWPLQRGFDRYFGGLDGAFNYFRPGGVRGMTRDNEREKVGDDFYVTDAFTDEACRYITDATKADDRPFFLYLAYNAPHWPLSPKAADFERYRGKYREGWKPLMAARFAKQQELGLFGPEVEPAPHLGPEWESLRPKRRDNLDAIMAAYAGCIDSIDQNIGKLYAHLESVGEADNTLILFLSDNGACQEGGRLGNGSEEMVRNPPPGTEGVRLGEAWANACNTPFRLYKHFVHEGGVCTPFVAHWPAGMKAADRGGFVRHAAYLPDVMATCVELASATYPESKPPCVGKSLAATLRGGEGAIHTEPLYWEHEGNAAVRWGDWKLVRRYQQPWELYDIANDRTELHDLSEANSDKRDELVALWEAWATEHGVAFPERFDMYQHLRQLKEDRQKQAEASAAAAEGA